MLTQNGFVSCGRAGAGSGTGVPPVSFSLVPAVAPVGTHGRDARATTPKTRRMDCKRIYDSRRMLFDFILRPTRTEPAAAFLAVRGRQIPLAMVRSLRARRYLLSRIYAENFQRKDAKTQRRKSLEPRNGQSWESLFRERKLP